MAIPVLLLPAFAVTVGPGVVFAPSQSWANLSFAASQTFSSITVDPTGVTFDSVRFGVLKFPQSLPRLDVLISVWNPFQTTVNGTVFDFTGNASSGSTVYFLFSGITPARQYLVQVDGVTQLQPYSDAAGNLSFVWGTWTVHRFTLLFGWKTGTPPSPPSADFTFAPANPIVSEVVNFSATATGGVPPYIYSWNLGDGSSAFGQALDHSYTSPATYSVVLTVVDSAGGSASVTKSIVVSPGTPTPRFTANFTFAPPSPIVNESVNFTAAVSGGVPPYTLSWDFGDGGTGAGAIVSHAYASTGTFYPTLHATDSASHTANASEFVVVREVPPPVPTGNVTADFDYTVQDLTVSFADRSNSSAGLPIVSWYWGFGDSSASRDASPVHTYNVTGLQQTFRVVLVACDSGGHCGSTSRDITLTNSGLIYTTVGLLIVIVAVALLILLLLRRRRRKRTPVTKIRRTQRVVKGEVAPGPEPRDEEAGSSGSGPWRPPSG